MNDMDDRKLMEAEFHDALRQAHPEQIWTPEKDLEFEADPLWANMKYYSVERKNRAYVTRWLEQHCRGKDVLDYCCGNGFDSVRIAQGMQPRSVVGIDISEVSIEHSRERARQSGVTQLVHFEVMDAEDLKFPDDSFDTIHIYGVLHHLDLRKAYPELARVLRPGGRLIATEAMKHNPVIAWYRKRTPQLRTPWEANHILGRQEIGLARAYFDEVEVRLFNLATLAAVPFRRTRVFKSLLTMLEAVDDIMLSIPGFKWMAWMAVFSLAKRLERGRGAGG
jgi:SAM-dependent methyltransferase